ncbi:hypothetical protein GQ457_07G011280 [Hibiscus cannabinus]
MADLSNNLANLAMADTDDEISLEGILISDLGDRRYLFRLYHRWMWKGSRMRSLDPMFVSLHFLNLWVLVHDLAIGFMVEGVHDLAIGFMVEGVARQVRHKSNFPQL